MPGERRHDVARFPAVFAGGAPVPGLRDAGVPKPDGDPHYVVERDAERPADNVDIYVQLGGIRPFAILRVEARGPKAAFGGRLQRFLGEANVGRVVVQGRHQQLHGSVGIEQLKALHPVRCVLASYGPCQKRCKCEPGQNPSNVGQPIIEDSSPLCVSLLDVR